MARPHQQMPRRSIRSFALLAALMALLGVAATGCGTEDEEPAKDGTEQTEGEDAATDGEDAAADEEAADDTESGADEEPAEGDEAAADEEDA